MKLKTLIKDLEPFKESHLFIGTEDRDIKNNKISKLEYDGEKLVIFPINPSLEPVNAFQLPAS